MMQARITRSSPLAAWKTLVSGSVKLFHKFERSHPERGRKMRGGRKNLRFSANVGIRALDVARSTEIHALDMALGIIRRQV